MKIDEMNKCPVNDHGGLCALNHSTIGSNVESAFHWFEGHLIYCGDHNCPCLNKKGE